MSWALWYSQHQPAVENPFATLAEGKKALTEALQEELQAARRRSPRARLHRTKRGGFITLGPSKDSALWMGITLTQI